MTHSGFSVCKLHRLFNCFRDVGSTVNVAGVGNIFEQISDAVVGTKRELQERFPIELYQRDLKERMYRVDYLPT